MIDQCRPPTTNRERQLTQFERCAANQLNKSVHKTRMRVIAASSNAGGNVAEYIDTLSPSTFGHLNVGLITTDGMVLAMALCSSVRHKSEFY